MPQRAIKDAKFFCRCGEWFVHEYQIVGHIKVNASNGHYATARENWEAFRRARRREQLNRFRESMTPQHRDTYRQRHAEYRKENWLALKAAYAVYDIPIEEARRMLGIVKPQRRYVRRKIEQEYDY